MQVAGGGIPGFKLDAGCGWRDPGIQTRCRWRVAGSRDSNSMQVYPGREIPCPPLLDPAVAACSPLCFSYPTASSKEKSASTFGRALHQPHSQPLTSSLTPVPSCRVQRSGQTPPSSPPIGPQPISPQPISPQSAARRQTQSSPPRRTARRNRRSSRPPIRSRYGSTRPLGISALSSQITISMRSSREAVASLI